MSNPYVEYRTNLYTDAAMALVKGDGNFYAERIPLSAVRDRFLSEEVATYPTAYVVPGTDPNGLDDRTVVDPSTGTVVRIRDGKVHGRFGAESAATRRQYTFLVDLAAGVTSESPGDLRITGAGTTRNGGRAYLQISTADVLTVAGMDYAPFVNLGMSHDGSLSVVSTTGSMILVCANMVSGMFGRGKIGNRAERRGGRTKQTSRVTDAGIITRHKIMLGLEEQTDAMNAALRDLSSIVVSDDMFTAFLNEIAPVNVEGASKNQETRNENTRSAVNRIYRHDARAAEWQGSALGVLQAVNTFDLWERGTRGDTDAGTRMVDEFLSGKLTTRENDRAESLARVLATV